MAPQMKMAAEIDPRTAKKEVLASSNLSVNYTTEDAICQVQIAQNPSIEEIEHILNEGIIRRYERMQAQAAQAKAQAVETVQYLLSIVQTAEDEARKGVELAQSRADEQLAKIHSCEMAIKAAEVKMDELITRAKLAGLADNTEVGQAIIAAVEAQVTSIEHSIQGHRLARGNAEKVLAEAQEALNAAQSHQVHLATIVELARTGQEAEALEMVTTDQELEVVSCLVEAHGLHRQAQTFRETIPADVQAFLEARETIQKTLAMAQKSLEDGHLLEAQNTLNRALNLSKSCNPEDYEGQLQGLKAQLAQAWIQETQRLARREEIRRAREALECAQTLGATQEALASAERVLTIHDLRHRVKCVSPDNPQAGFERLDALRQEAEELEILSFVSEDLASKRKALTACRKQSDFLWAQSRRQACQLAANPPDEGAAAYSAYGAGRVFAWGPLGKKFQAIRVYQWVGGRDGHWVDGPPARRLVVDTLPRQAMRVEQAQVQPQVQPQ